MGKIADGISRSVERKRRLQERRKVTVKAGKMKKQHDVIYNRIGLEAHRIDYEA